MRFNGVCEHVPGKSLVVADALSRSKVTRSSLSETEQTFVDEVESYAENVMKTWPASSQKIKEIAVETAKCPELSLVYRYTQEGWPQFAKEIPKSLQSYFAARTCLSSVQGVLTYLNRIVIPASLRQDVLMRLHAGHQGQQKVRPRCDFGLVAHSERRHTEHLQFMRVLRREPTIEASSAPDADRISSWTMATPWS